MHPDRKRRWYQRSSVTKTELLTVFIFSYWFATNDSLPLPMSPPLLLHSVQITSLLSLRSFIFHSWAQIVSCCLPSCSFIKAAATQCQQAAPSDSASCLFLHHPASEAGWIGKFSAAGGANTSSGHWLTRIQPVVILHAYLLSFGVFLSWDGNQSQVISKISLWCHETTSQKLCPAFSSNLQHLKSSFQKIILLL